MLCSYLPPQVVQSSVLNLLQVAYVCISMYYPCGFVKTKKKQYVYVLRVVTVWDTLHVKMVIGYFLL